MLSTEQQLGRHNSQAQVSSAAQHSARNELHMGNKLGNMNTR
jgi:hypothetical protein